MAALNLYLIRHGIAEDHSPDLDDADRCLTHEGDKKTKAIAKKLHNLGLRFDLLQTSPLTRASQTAEIFGRTFDTPVQTSEYLAPNGSFKDWLRWFLTWQEDEHSSLGIVGHEPDLSAWAELLVFGEVKGAFLLKKAGVIGITIPEVGLPIGNSILFLLIPPKLLT
jgi:phosphohistidine phosphatase